MPTLVRPRADGLRRLLRVPELRPPGYIALDMAFALGEGATLFDKSRYRAHGTITGADWATGNHGYCLDFVRASKDFVSIPAAYSHLDFTSEAFSIVVRAKPDDVVNVGRLFIRGRLSYDGYAFYQGGSGAVLFWTAQSGAYQLTASASGQLVAGTRYTLGMSRDGSAVKVYKNGVDVTSISGTHIDPATCARKAYIGIDYDESSEALDGQVEFVRVIKGIALEASEHLAWHNALV